ncbi:MAG: stress response translation initiation inhibitor YciH [Fervidobacterium sp.]
MVEKIGVCPTCGLPLDICTCKVIEREARKIRVYMTTRKFGKPVTIVEGIDDKSVKPVLKNLKQKLACGGSFKEGKIELQGNHTLKTKDILVKLGFDKDLIEVS